MFVILTENVSLVGIASGSIFSFRNPFTFVGTRSVPFGESDAPPVGKLAAIGRASARRSRRGLSGLRASSLAGSSQLATDHRTGRVRVLFCPSAPRAAPCSVSERFSSGVSRRSGCRVARLSARRRSGSIVGCRRCHHPRDAAPTVGCHGARRRDHLTHGNDSRLVGWIVSRLA